MAASFNLFPPPSPVHYFGTEDGTIWHHAHSLNSSLPTSSRNSRLMRTQRSVAICLRVLCVFAGAAARRAARCPWTAPSSATPALGRSSTLRSTTPAEKVSDTARREFLRGATQFLFIPYQISAGAGRGPPKAKLFCSPQCNGSYLLPGRGPLKRHLFLHRHREWASRRRQSCSRSLT